MKFQPRYWWHLSMAGGWLLLIKAANRVSAWGDRRARKHVQVLRAYAGIEEHPDAGQ